MKIAIGCDHAGFHLKEEIKKFLLKRGDVVEDKGANSDESVDYPDFVHPVAQLIEKGAVDLAVLICGSGNGVAMTANKYPDVRCGLCWKSELAVLAREHNNANILALPARFIDVESAIEITEKFLTADFEGGRHARRVGKITPHSEKHC